MKSYVFLFLIFFSSCSRSFQQSSIYVEKIPEIHLNNENKFDIDNVIYPIGKEMVFKFLLSKNDTIINTKTSFIKLNILGSTKPFSNFDSEYSQTVVQYLYYDANNKLMLSEKTGLIENDRNIWLHPPRSADAAILQLSAFPYIKFQKAKKWNWKVEASFEEYKNVTLNHQYKLKKNSKYNTDEFGIITCDLIQATSTSEIGTTYSSFLFNREFGFVLLEFFNIDGTKITLTLLK